MHHLLHHHIIAHVIAPLVVSTAIAIALGATADKQGSHPLPTATKVHAPLKKGH